MNDIIKVINILNNIPEPFSVDGIIKTFESSSKDFIKSFALYFYKENTEESRLWYVSKNKLVINDKSNNKEYKLFARGNKFGYIILNTDKNKNEIEILISYLSIILYSEKLSFLANRDKLTGLYNRGYILKYLQEKEITNEIYSIVIVDLDKFKHYNDTYGHNIGDHVLKLVSKVMKESLKKIKYKSVLARYGGEEFIIAFDIDNKKTLIEAEYLSQRNKGYRANFKTDKERLDEAMRLVNKYAKARMVVTSRIHCALPCLGLETPVILTEDYEQSERKACRMGGIHDFFHTISFRKNGFETNFPFYKSKKLSISTVSINKDSWKEYASKLAETCKDFISKDNEYITLNRK